MNTLRTIASLLIIVCVVVSTAHIAAAQKQRDLNVQRNVVCKTYRAPNRRMNITSASSEISNFASKKLNDTH